MLLLSLFCCCCYHYFVVVADIIMLLSLLCCYCLFLVYSKYKKIIKINSKLNFRKLLISLSPENNQALHMVSEPGFKTETWA
jgi:hypothetical protein